jgi:hypothetical protein
VRVRRTGFERAGSALGLTPQTKGTMQQPSKPNSGNRSAWASLLGREVAEPCVMHLASPGRSNVIGLQSSVFGYA